MSILEKLGLILFGIGLTGLAAGVNRFPPWTSWAMFLFGVLLILFGCWLERLMREPLYFELARKGNSEEK